MDMLEMQKGKRKQKIKEEINKLREELLNIETEERKNRSTSYIGKYFRLQNKIKSPESPSDWWIYKAITGFNEDGFLLGWEFDTDEYGIITIGTKLGISEELLGEEISYKQFMKAWNELLNVLRMQSRKGEDEY